MNIQLPAQFHNQTAAAQQRVSVDLSLSGLPAEENFTAKVLFASGETVHLKTAEGLLVKARLEGGVTLAEGSVVMLETVEKSADTLLLRVAQVLETPTEAATGAPGGALRALAAQLQAPNLSPQQRIELVMRALFAARPTAAAPSAPQSATANPLPINPEAQMGQMLTELLSLLAESDATAKSLPPMPGQAAPLETGLGGAAAKSLATATANTIEAGAPQAATGGGPAAAAPQLEPLRLITSVLYTLLAPEEAAQSGQAQAAAGAPNAATATGAALPQGLAAAINPPQAQAQSGATAAVRAEVPPTLPDSAPPVAGNAAEAKQSAAAATAQPEAPAPAQPGQLPEQPAGPGAARPSPEQAAAQLRQLPTAEALPPQQLTEFMATARQIMSELRPNPERPLDAKTSAEFVERLFASAHEHAPEAAKLLKKAVSELELRLSFLEEAVNRSELSNKNELLSQTQKMLSHAESLRLSERFDCLQIPIFYQQQKQTAELYVYRRTQGRQKIDPANATILLALDTAHLGRLETYIQVKAKEISLKLETSRAEAVPFLRERGGALYGLLAEAGYKLTSAAIQPLQQKTTVANAETALTAFAESFGSKINFTV